MCEPEGLSTVEGPLRFLQERKFMEEANNLFIYLVYNSISESYFEKTFPAFIFYCIITFRYQNLFILIYLR